MDHNSSSHSVIHFEPTSKYLFLCLFQVTLPYKGRSNSSINLNLWFFSKILVAHELQLN